MKNNQLIIDIYNSNSRSDLDFIREFIKKFEKDESIELLKAFREDNWILNEKLTNPNYPIIYSVWVSKPDVWGGGGRYIAIPSGILYKDILKIWK